jgi:hypothetical protein
MGISIRAYARHRGVSHTAVEKAIAAGRISTQPDGGIDPAVADVEWEHNTLYPQAGGGNSAEFTRARTVHEHYRARLAKLAYDEKAGMLVSKAEVQTAAFNQYRQFRDAMFNIPPRVAAQLAAETDEARVYELLVVEIRKALNDYADAASS